ncbi:hypothetical protein G6M02_09645, partial [Agrobacterium rhizogenes]|nr:hypothetical protein [Rhizobium rhizogenes]
WLRTATRRYPREYNNPKPPERTQNWIKLGGNVTFGHYNFVDLEVDDEAISAFLGTPVGANDVSALSYQKHGTAALVSLGPQ